MQRTTRFSTTTFFSSSFPISICCCCVSSLRFAHSWQETIKERIAKERERIELEKQIPTKIVVEDDKMNSGVFITQDVSPAKVQEMIDESLQHEEINNNDDANENIYKQQDQIRTRGNNEEETTTTRNIDIVEEGENDHNDDEAYQDAKEAFERRQEISQVLRAQKADRREKKARWLMWQAAQREKGFEARVRREVNKQANRQRLHYSTVGARYLSVGDRHAVNAVGSELQDNINEMNSEEQEQDDAEYDDFLGIQEKNWGTNLSSRSGSDGMKSNTSLYGMHSKIH